MQTFLPAEDFQEAVRLLDPKRLGKQRVESLQVMGSLTGLRWSKEREQVEEAAGKGWSNHPVVRMWRGHERALLEYQRATCAHWTSLGFQDTCLEKTEALFAASSLSRELVLPPWLTPAFCASHRAALLWKDGGFYSRWGWTEEPAYDYLWPSL